MFKTNEVLAYDRHAADKLLYTRSHGAGASATVTSAEEKNRVGGQMQKEFGEIVQREYSKQNSPSGHARNFITDA